MAEKQFSHPEQIAAQEPERPALIMADDQSTLSYGRLASNANRIANAMMGAGVQPGDTIAVVMENGPDMVQTAWAAKNSGLRYVMVSTRLNENDTKYVLSDSGATIILTDEFHAQRFAQMDLERDLRRKLRLLEKPAHGFSALFSDRYNGDATPLAGRRRGASMLYSSGTTGRPKGIHTVIPDEPPETPPPRHALVSSMFEFSPEMIFINPGPWYHAAPLRLMMSVHRVGGTVIGFRKFDAEQVLAAIDRYKATHGFFVPTMFSRMLDLPAPVRERYNVSSMRHAIHGAAPCPPHVKRAMIDWFGPVIDELYGGTESIGQTFITSKEWLAHPGSVGKPPEGVDAKIVDENGVVLPAGEIGRVFLRGKQRFEYRGEAASNADLYDADGFASFGDIGYLDSDGYLYLTDRESNMIISGGVNIYPQEAETVLLEHPAVEDVAVIGVPHSDMGEQTKALILSAAGVVNNAELADDILTWCTKRLSKYKCPRSLEFVDELPRNELGKLVKRHLPDAMRGRPGPYKGR